MSFPACKHGKAKTGPPRGLQWLASEPFRVFFFSGALWSVVGVSLWPLFYQGQLGFYPAIMHSRLMIEAFGGAFVVGFLGTAGPRMASAPKLSPAELLGLFALHQASALCHLRLHHFWGDALFALLLLALTLSLTVRVARFRREWPPPQMLLALTGLFCGISGAILLMLPSTAIDAQKYRLAGLLLYQGLLLPPVLGIGSFLFPRILGGEFGDPTSPKMTRIKRRRAVLAALLLVGSFFVEAYGWPQPALALRTLTAVAYLLLEVRWRLKPGEPPPGSLASGLRWSLASGLGGLLLAGSFYSQHVAMEHLLYIGGFGLLMLVVGSRVLFGHSGDLPGFERRSGLVRFLIFLGLLTATTRMTPGFLPQLTVSHLQYAAWSWSALALLWLAWHRHRFLKRED
jgi:uncharacterized protein involved in response to NO